MFLAGQPAAWAAPKPFLQGLGAARVEKNLQVDILFINGSSRSRFVNVRLYLYAEDKPLTLKVRNPRLAPGVHEKVVLHVV